MSPALPESTSVDPILSAALACLDVTLETELAQFRCHRLVKQLSPAMRRAEEAGSEILRLDPPLQNPTQLHSQRVGMNLVAAEKAKFVATPDSLPDSSAELTTGPDRHLASTQALLRNLAEPQPLTSSPRSWLLRPLRIISLLLLGASFPTGYLMLASPPEAPVLEASPPEVALTPETAANPPKANPSPSPQTVSNATVPKDAQSSKSSPKLPTVSGNYYYVIADYPNPEALKRVQNIVPGAYVQDFPEGERVQVGAFNQQKPAQELVEQLEQQGISAMVREPQ